MAASPGPPDHSLDQFLRQALDASPNAFALHRIIRDGTGAFQDLEIAYQSTAAARLAGGAPPGMRGQRLLEPFPSHRGSEAWEGYRRVVETGEPLRHEVNYRGEGIEGWFETTAFLVGDEYLAISGHDTTQQRRAQEALRLTARAGAPLSESLDPAETMRSLSRLLVPRLGDLCVVDLIENGQVERVAFRAAEPHSLPELLASGSVPAEGAEGLAKVLRTGQAELVAHVTDAWLRETTRDPERLTLARKLGLKSVLIAPIRHLDRIVGAVTVCATQAHRRPYDADDIPVLEAFADRAASAIAKTRLYEVALKTRQVREDTVALVSHDLRGHLNSILLNVASLARHGNTPELDCILRGAAQASALVSELATTARLEDGQLPLERRPQSIATLVREVTELHQTAARKQGVELEWSAASELPHTPFDVRRIQQVLSNLIANALEATPSGGRVVVWARREGQHLLVSVADDGVGIGPDERTHLFDRYGQATPSRRAGAGLGLTIARGLIQQHGGTLRVESELGKGATFTFSLPIALSQPPGDGAATPDHSAVEKGERLLADSQTFAESVLDTLAESLLVLDADFRVRSANRSFHATFGLTPQETIGSSLFALCEGAWDAPGLRARLEGLSPSNPIKDLRLEHAFQCSGVRALILNARRIERSQLILLEVEDVTEREQAQKALEGPDLGFHAGLMAAAEAIVMADGEGRLVFANHGAAQLFGYTSEEMMGLSVDHLLPKRLRTRHEQHRARFAQTPGATAMRSDTEFTACRKNGTEFPIAISLNSVSPGGSPLVLCFITDLTRKREADARIRDYQDKLRRMTFDAVVVAEHERRKIALDLHDRIGQSLALARIKLMSIGDLGAGAPRVAIKDAIELLEQSASDTRTLTFELSPPVLYDLGLRAALSWLAEDLHKRLGLRVEVQDDGGLYPLHEITAAVVFRTVRELLTNVTKHANSDTARVALQRTGDRLHLRVEDDGVGFDSPKEGATPRGGGFGLFSVREQINRVGGEIEVSSATGSGTRVTLLVPLRIVQQ